MSKKNETKVAPWVHSIAGGCGGALGAIITNPLEVNFSIFGEPSQRLII